MTESRTIDVGYGAIAVGFAAIVAYAISLANGFAFDDVVLIPGDPRVTGAQFGALLTQSYWHDSTLALYRPLTSLTFGLDWSLAKGAPAWFHFTNVLWHALASILAYRLLTRFFSPVAALCGALVFALHPVHVEAVANVVGRSELMAATFVLAACVVWTSRSLSLTARAVFAALCGGAAMFAKESAAVLPALLLLLDYASGKVGRDYVRANVRAFVPLVAVLVIFLAVRTAVVGAAPPARLDPSIEFASSTSARVLTALQAWPIEFKLLFFPHPLLADYGPRILQPVNAWTPLAVLGLTLLVATLVGGIVAVVRGHRLAALALLWFPLTILPVSNLLFPIGVLVAERTLYLPSFVVSIAVAAAVTYAVSPLRTFSPTPLRWLAVAMLVVLAARTVTRIPDWRSTDSIMLALVRDRPDAFRGQWHLARMARARGDASAAVARYDRALKLWPHREGLVQEAAAYGGSQGRSAWARDVAAWGGTRWPNNINFHRMIASQAIDQGDTATARRAVLNGLRLDPNDQLLNAMQRAFGAATTTVP